MDKIKLLSDLFLLIIIVDGINCDSKCDCTSLIDEQGFIKTKLSQIEFDNYKIKARLRRLEASKWHSTQPNDEIAGKESDMQSTHDDKKEETHDKGRIASVEARLAGIESLLKITGELNDTDVQQGTIQSEVLVKVGTNLSSVSVVLDQIETKLSSLSQQNTIVNNDGNEAVPGNVVRKTLLAEKRSRITFEAVVKKSVEEIKTSLFDLTEKLTNVTTGLSSLRDVPINNKIEVSVAFTAYDLKRRSSSSSILLFQSTFINNGNAYDTTTGKLICEIPGVYFFSVTLTKTDRKLVHLSAFLRINYVEKLVMHWSPTSDEDSEEEMITLTQSGTFHLNKNDAVDIYGIPKYYVDGYYSIFTGFLITPD